VTNIIDRIINRIHDAPMPTEHLLDDTAETIARLRSALLGMVDHYTQLVNSGDAGNWDPEKEPVVIAARAALRE